jgi:uncharacterized protein DUF4260
MSDTSPAVTGLPRLILRIEGGALAALAIFLYPRTGESWWLFAILILAPDLGMLGYMVNARAGALAYNILHITALPFALALIGLTAPSATLVAIALIWLAHIGLDRMLGYGLKYDAGFAFTHLGRLGR